MTKLKFAGAAFASAAIMALTPVAAHAETCNECFGGCIDTYGDDNSESGYHSLSQLFYSCYDSDGFQCMVTQG